MRVREGVRGGTSWHSFWHSLRKRDSALVPRRRRCRALVNQSARPLKRNRGLCDVSVLRIRWGRERSRNMRWRTGPLAVD
jgi:hypothetical protein